MAEYQLEFEKPILVLQEKLRDLKESGAAEPDIAAAERKLKRTVKKIYSGLTPWQRVQVARHPERPYTLDYIDALCSGFLELSGDRRFKDDKAVVGGFAEFRGKTPVMVIGTQKGRDMHSNLFRNFGWPNPEGYRKAMRLMRLAEKAGVPVLTFIDTPGAYPGIASEERHIGEAIAVNLRDMFELKVPVICSVIGEGGSGGAIGLGVGNRILMLENAYYSVITPEGCAAILWNDRQYAPQAAAALGLTAEKLLELGVIDGIVPEPPGGAHSDYQKAAENLGDAIEKHLGELIGRSPEQLREERYAKFRKMGIWRETADVK